MAPEKYFYERYLFEAAILFELARRVLGLFQGEVSPISAMLILSNLDAVL